MSAEAASLKLENGAAIRRANELYSANKLDEAAQVIEEVLLRDPNDAQALTVSATILKKAKRLPLAYSLAKRATELAPARPEPWNAYGHCAQSLWRLEEAHSGYRKALQRAKSRQQQALYLNNIGSSHIDAGEFEKAEALVRQSLDLDPNDRMARHNMGLCLLARRQWKEAWPYYSASVGTESRLNVKYMPDPGEPTWDGTKGKTVVVYGEQGLGDEIVAASMYSEVAADCERLILDCDHRLAPLFKRSFPAAKVYGTRWQKGLAWAPEDRRVDYSIASFELGKFYRNADADFHSRPYLIPCPDRTSMWRSFFAGKAKPVIGIAWSGGTWHNAAIHRRVELVQWRPIFDSIDAHWVSLQYKDASKEIEGTPVTQYSYATLTKDYDDTAAMVAAMDLVISVPTTIVHLAAALGTPTIAMMSSKSCWKFAGGLAWHPGVRLVPNSGDWSKTVTETAQSIRQVLKGSAK